MSPLSSWSVCTPRGGRPRRGVAVGARAHGRVGARRPRDVAPRRCDVGVRGACRRAALARGRPRGPLDGVPVTVKENIATAGIPTPLGTAAAELVPATADAPVVARLREAGAVIVAKTTMPDYGMLTSGVSSLHPTTRNPWNPAWTPGGSSAGARRPRPPRDTGPFTSARTSAGRCDCRPAGRESSASSRASGGSRWRRRITGESPGR